MFPVKSAKKDSLLGFCDLMCRYSEMPKEGALDGSGSCKTFIAIYCSRKKSFVHKNMPCSQKQVRRNGDA
jgi:hypothetical protein